MPDSKIVDWGLNSCMQNWNGSCLRRQLPEDKEAAIRTGVVPSGAEMNVINFSTGFLGRGRRRCVSCAVEDCGQAQVLEKNV